MLSIPSWEQKRTPQRNRLQIQLVGVAHRQTSSLRIYRTNVALPDPRQLASLAGADWIRSGHSILITGATGLGKTWLACALGQAACRHGFAVLYTRFSRLLEELRIAHGDGSFSRRLQQLARTDLLILDDWGLAPIGQPERTDLLELLDDRTTGKATLITSQLPVEHWYAYLNDPTLADAILDRIVHSSHRLPLKGDSLRKKAATPATRK